MKQRGCDGDNETLISIISRSWPRVIENLLIISYFKQMVVGILHKKLSVDSSRL